MALRGYRRVRMNKGPPVDIRKLNISETEEAHSLISSVTAWLESENIDQWDSVLPISVFSQFVVEQSAYGVFELTEMQALFVLRRKSLAEYASESDGDVLWLSTVCVDRRYAGLGIGRMIIDYVKSNANEAVFLDCVAGVLPKYYASYGFAEVMRKKLYRKQMVLMKWHWEPL